MSTFSLLGAAGYIAPRHFQAIRDTGNTLVAAIDPSDSVGILDKYFPEATFFKDTASWEQFMRESKQRGNPIDWITICSPNYLHDQHVRFGLQYGADVVCEKPLVLNLSNAESLLKTEEETGKKVYTILQLRLLKSIQDLRSKILATSDKKYIVQLEYITPRGPWYQVSWKGNPELSGGIATNIGIHFFDLLLWLFGPLQSLNAGLQDAHRSQGHMELQRASVTWNLSINPSDLPTGHVGAFRQLSVDGELIDLSAEFESLHTLCYSEILAGRGFGIGDVIPSIALVSELRKK
ncbi:MAG: Gfo/Idh/MocA family oxidoreductase [Saprospiraceae bacterium]